MEIGRIVKIVTAEPEYIPIQLPIRVEPKPEPVIVPAEPEPVIVPAEPEPAYPHPAPQEVRG